MALKIFFFLRSYHPPPYFPRKACAFPGTFLLGGKINYAHANTRREVQVSLPLPPRFVRFLRFLEVRPFFAAFKKTGGRKEYGEKLGKKVCRLFFFFSFSRSFSTRGALSFRRRFKPRKNRGPSCSIAQCMHVESSYPNVAFLNTVHSKSDRKNKKKRT